MRFGEIGDGLPRASFRYSTVDRVLLIKLRCESITPLGMPVLPEV